MSDVDNKYEYEILPEECAENDLSFKIIIIGDAAVGKSSLTLNAVHNKFLDCYTPTIGFEFSTLNIRVNDKYIKLQIWDTCGQEAYRSLINSFYRNSSLAMIVYAINDEKSYKNIFSIISIFCRSFYKIIKIMFFTKFFCIFSFHSSIIF